MICPFCLKNVPSGASECPHCFAQSITEYLPGYCGIFRRFFALFLDSLLAGLIFGIFFIMGTSFFSRNTSAVVIMIGYVALGIFMLVEFILVLSKGQTIGKKMMGIKIIRSNFQAASGGTIFIREFIGRFLCSLTFGIGYLIAFFNKNKTGLHDKIAGTIVVKKNTPMSRNVVFGFQTQAPKQPNIINVNTNASVNAHAQEFPQQSPPAPPPPPVGLASETNPPISLDTSASSSREICPGCKSPIEDPESKFCLVCGYPLKREVTKPLPALCPNCGTPYGTGDHFCPNCGAQLKREISSPSLREEDLGDKTTVVTAPRLISYKNDGKKEEFTITVPMTKIGRMRDNHICIPEEKSISGHHCEIYMEEGKFYIRDLNSTNGVYLNDKKVDIAPLNSGDKIKLGYKIFRFEV